MSNYNFNLGDTTIDNHEMIDRIATFSGGTWINKNYNANFGGQWCFIDSFKINDSGYAIQRITAANGKTILATRYCNNGVWGDWDIGVTKSDLENRILDRTCDSLSSGYLPDATLVITNQGESNPYSRINSSAFRVHKDHTKNMPDGCSFGVRTCQNYDGNNVIVKIEEFYPVPGRIWLRKYVIGTGWDAWKSITPT